MESPIPYSKGLQKHSIMKQSRSGYEPSDTETERNEPPWNQFNKKSIELNSGIHKMSSDLNPLRLSRRHSSKFDPEGLPPPRRHSKSPYKTRRDDGNPRSPSPGPLPLPPGRNTGPFSKSECRWHISPFVPSRGDDPFANNKQKHKLPIMKVIGKWITLEHYQHLDSDHETKTKG